MYINSGTRRQSNDESFGDLFTVVGQHSVTVGTSPTKKFGVIPTSIVSVLSENGDDIRARTQAVDELKILFEDPRNINLVVPHFDGLVEFVGCLLDDHSFKVSSAAIDIFAALVRRLPWKLVALKADTLVTILCRHLGNTNGFSRESVTKILTQLMHIATSALVLSSLCTVGLSHRNARVRQETINLVIIALLTFPSSDFDLPHVAKTVAIALIDERRPVRQAALECYAVLAQALGRSKRSVLMGYVSEVEARNGGGSDLTAAVNARLNNRLLPKQDSSGLVQYATYLNRFSGASTPTPDIEWILSASTGLGSAKSSASDGVLSSRISARSSGSNVQDDYQPFGSSRLRRSARRGFSRLPWDHEGNVKVNGDLEAEKEFHGSYVGHGAVASAKLESLTRENVSCAAGEDCIAPSQPSTGRSDWSVDSTAEDEPLSASCRLLKRSSSKRRIDRIFQADHDRNQRLTNVHSESAIDRINCKPMAASRTTEAWLTTGTNETLSTSRQNPSPPIIVRQPQYVSGTAMGNTHGDLTEPVLGFSNDSSAAVGIHRPAILKPHQKQKPSRAGLAAAATPTPNSHANPYAVSDPPNVIGRAVFDPSVPSHETVEDSTICAKRAQDVIQGHHAAHRVSPACNIMTDYTATADTDSMPGTRLKGKLSKATQDKLLRSAKFSKPPSGATTMMMKRTMAANESDYVIDDADLRADAGGWALSAARRDFASEENDNNANNTVNSAWEIPSAAGDGPVREKPTRRLSGRNSRPRLKSASDALLSKTDDPMADDGDPTKTQPVKDPPALLSKALKLIESPDENWEMKCQGLNRVRQLAYHHPKVFGIQLHSVTLAVTTEVRNLRSVVSLLALRCLADLFQYTKKDMVSELDHTVITILSKTADTNQFIRDDAMKTLEAMIHNVPPQKALSVLVANSTGHRNSVIRNASSRLVVSVAETLGPGRVLSGIRDITDRLLSTAANFMLDSSPETRYSGQKILYSLMMHEDFDQMMNRYVSSDVLHSINDKLESLKRKGLGEPPLETKKGALDRKGSFRTNVISNSAPPSAVGKRDRSIGRTTSTTAAASEDLSLVTSCLRASDFRERCRGLDMLRELAGNNPVAVCNNVTMIFDRFVPCLKDVNGKVTLTALSVLCDILPCVGPHMTNVVSLTVSTVAANLASSNREIHDSASQAISQLIQLVDPNILLPSFASQALSGNIRCRPEMVEWLAALVPKLFPRKSCQSALVHLLPVVWSLISSTPSAAGGVANSAASLRSATERLVAALYLEIGDSLVDEANNTSSVSLRARENLRRVIAQSGAICRHS